MSSHFPPKAPSEPEAPRLWAPTSAVPSNTNGKAVPSLSPASPVSVRRTRSRSSGCVTCTSEASTGFVGATIAAISSATCHGSCNITAARPAISATDRATPTLARRTGACHRASFNATRKLQPGAEQGKEKGDLCDVLDEARVCHEVEVKQPAEPCGPMRTPIRRYARPDVMGSG